MANSFFLVQNSDLLDVMKRNKNTTTLRQQMLALAKNYINVLPIMLFICCATTE